MSQKISKQNALIIEFIKSEFKTNEFIPLHEPRFLGNEKTIDPGCNISELGLGVFRGSCFLKIFQSISRSAIVLYPVLDTC